MKRLLLLIGILIIILVLLLLLFRCTRQGPEVEVSSDWTYKPEEEKPLVRFIPLAEGGALAATSAGEVYAIDINGGESLLVAGVVSDTLPRVVFNATGDTFGILRDEVFTLYDPQGTKLSELPVQGGMFKLVPSSRRIYSPEVRQDGPEDRLVLNARILDVLGTVQASWPAQGLEISRLTSQHLVYATNNELTKTTLSGGELWRIPIKVRKLKISADAAYSLVNSAHTSSKIHYFRDDTELGNDDLGSPVWNLALSPDGRFAVASTQTKLYIYSEGTRLQAIELNLEYAVSIAINDEGEVLVGGQTGEHNARVLLYDKDGTLLWEESAGTDDSAWRPEVRFDAIGNHYLVRHKDRLVSYTIERSP